MAYESGLVRPAGGTNTSYDGALVGEHSRREVAQRAGVEPEYVDRLVELGILRPGPGDAFSQGDVLRARWVHGLEEAGVPLNGMAAAVRDGTLSFTFLDAAAFDRFTEVSSTTFLELSTRTGVPLDLLKVIREAVGFAEPQPEDHVREDELAVVPAIELQLSTGLRSIMIGRWLRVCADSLRRITETETDWYRAEVMAHFTEERGDEAAAEVAERLAALVRRSSQEHDGEPVKWLGDGVMFYFADPGHGVLAALQMVEGVVMEGLPPAHVGIHAGPVVFQEGDYFGRTVNISARIAEYARPGEVLVSQEVVDAAEETAVTFTEIGPVELKGVSGTLRLHSARGLD